MSIKLLISTFVLFALSRAILRYRDGSLGLLGLLLWSLVWLGVGGIVWWPDASESLARLIGVGRGADALIYISIVALFYGMFRLYVKLEFIEHEITSLVRNLAVKNPERGKPDAP